MAGAVTNEEPEVLWVADSACACSCRRVACETYPKKCLTYMAEHCILRYDFRLARHTPLMCVVSVYGVC